MEDWRASVGRILSNTACSLEHGFNYSPQLPANDIAARQALGLDHSLKLSCGPPEPTNAVVLPRNSSPVPAQLAPVQPTHMIDAVLLKVVDKVDTLRETIKSIQVDVDVEKTKRELRDRETYLSMKAETNERIAQVQAEWRKAEQTLRRQILDIEESCRPFSRNGQPPPANYGNSSEYHFEPSDRLLERVFEIESDVNKQKRILDDRTRKLDAIIAEKVQEGIDRAMEKLRGVARDAGRQGAEEQWKLKSANMDAAIEDRLRRFQELHDGNNSLVIDLGHKVTRIGEQMKMDVSSHRESLKRDIDTVMEQQFLIRDWKDGLEGKIKLQAEVFDKRLAKMQTDILGAVTAFKQQVIEDERKMETTMKQNVTNQGEVILDKARQSIQHALKDISMNINGDLHKVQRQLSATQGQLESSAKDFAQRWTESGKTVEELISGLGQQRQSVAQLTTTLRQVQELTGSLDSDSKKTKREVKALRSEMSEGVVSMDKLGRDVESRLKDFAKTLKTFEKEAKDSATAMQESQHQTKTLHDTAVSRVEKMTDETDRMAMQLRFLSENVEEGRLRQDRGERRLDSFANVQAESRAWADDLRSKISRLESNAEEAKVVAAALQNRPIGITQSEVMNLVKGVKSEIKETYTSSVSQMVTQISSKAHHDLTVELRKHIQELHMESHSTVYAIEGRVEALDQEIHQIQDTMKLHAKAHTEGQADHAKMAQTINTKASELHMRAVGLEESIQLLKKGTALDSASISRIDGSINQMQAAIANLNPISSTTEEHTRKIDDLRREFQALSASSAIALSNPSVDRNTQRTVEEIRTQIQTMSNLGHQLGALKATTEDLESSLADVQTRISGLQSDQEAATDTAKQYVKTMEENKKDVESVKAAQKKMTTDYVHHEEWQEGYSSLQRSIKCNQDQIEDCQRDLSTLKSSSRQRSDEIAATSTHLSKEVGLLKTSAQDTNDQVASMKTQIQNFNTLGTSGDISNRVVGDREELQQMLRDFNTLKMVSAGNEEHTQREIASLKSSVQSQRDEVQILAMDVGSLRSLAVAEEDWVGVKDSLAGLKRELGDNSIASKHAKAQLEVLDKRISESELDIQNGIATLKQELKEEHGSSSKHTKSQLELLEKRMGEGEMDIENRISEVKHEISQRLQEEHATLSKHTKSQLDLWYTKWDDVWKACRLLREDYEDHARSVASDIEGLQTSTQDTGRGFEQFREEHSKLVKELKRRLDEMVGRIDTMRLACETNREGLEIIREDMDTQIALKIKEVQRVCDSISYSMQTKIDALSNHGKDHELSLEKLCEAQQCTAANTAKATDNFDKRLSKLQESVQELRKSLDAQVECTEETSRGLQEHCTVSEGEFAEHKVRIAKIQEQCGLIELHFNKFQDEQGAVNMEAQQKMDNLVKDSDDMTDALKRIATQMNGIEKLDGDVVELRRQVEEEVVGDVRDLIEKWMELEQRVSESRIRGAMSNAPDLPSPATKHRRRIETDIGDLRRAIDDMSTRIERTTKNEAAGQELQAMGQELQEVVQRIAKQEKQIRECMNGYHTLKAMVDDPPMVTEQLEQIVNAKVKVNSERVRVLTQTVNKLQADIKGKGSWDLTGIRKDLGALTRQVAELGALDRSTLSVTETVAGTSSPWGQTTPKSSSRHQARSRDRVPPRRKVASRELIPKRFRSTEPEALEGTRSSKNRHSRSVSPNRTDYNYQATVSRIIEDVAKLKTQMMHPEPVATASAQESVQTTESEQLTQHIQQELEGLKVDVATQQSRLSRSGTPDPAELAAELDGSAASSVETPVDLTNTLSDPTFSTISSRPSGGDVSVSSPGGMTWKMDDEVVEGSAEGAPVDAGYLSTDSIGTSDRLIASIQAETSELAGMVVSAYGKL